MIIVTNSSINKNDFDIKINNEKINVETEIKFLGIIIDDKLKFKSNIDYVVKKVERKVDVLGRNMYITNKQSNRVFRYNQLK